VRVGREESGERDGRKGREKGDWERVEKVGERKALDAQEVLLARASCLVFGWVG
jgi:hypothetical protein